MQLSFLDSFRAVPKDVPCDTAPCLEICLDSALEVC